MTLPQQLQQQGRCQVVRSDWSIAWGALTNWLAFLATLLTSFFLAPYLLERLGPSRYGVWCIVEAVLAYFTLFDLGIAACLVRYVARYHTLADLPLLNRYAASAFWLYSLLALVVLAISIPLSYKVATPLEQRLDTTDRVTPFMLLLLIQFAAGLPLSVFPTLLDGLQLFGWKSLVRLFALAGRISGIVLVMEMQPGLLGLALVLSITQLAEHLLMFVVVRWQLPGLSLSWHWLDRAALREIRHYSRDAFVAMVAGRLSGQSGPLLAGWLLSPMAAATYALASRLIDMGKNLLRSATTTLAPAISQREAIADHHGLHQLFVGATRTVLYLVLPIHLGIVFFGRPFLLRWLGSDELACQCYPLAVILSLTLTLGVAQSVAARILYGLGQLRTFSRLALLEGVVVLGTGYVLVQLGGLPGLALAVAGPNVLFCLWTITAACRWTHTRLADYGRRGCLRPLLVATVPLLIWWSLTPVLPQWTSLLLTAALGLIPYAALVLVVEDAIRQLVCDRVRRGLQRLLVKSSPPQQSPGLATEPLRR